MEQNSSGRGPAGGFDPGRLRDVQNWRRSRSDRLLGGVCGGVGRALDIDPVLVRVVMAVLVVVGPGVPLYIAAWLLMPEEGSDRSPAQGLLGDRVRPDHPWLWPVIIGAAVFIAIGMASSVHSGPFKLGPLIVVLLIWFVFFHRKDEDRKRRRPNGSAPPVAPPGIRPQDRPAGDTDASAGSAGQQDVPRSSSVQPVWTEDDPLGLYVDEAPPARRASSAVPAAPGRRGVKPVVFVGTLVAIGIASLAGASLSFALAIGLATLGAGMLVGGFIGRTLGLLPVGLLLAVGVVGTQLFPTVPEVSEVNRVAPPGETITATSTAYRFDAGSIKLDLTKATFAPGARITATGKAGEVVLTLPKDVDVTGSANVRLGEVSAFGQTRGGYDTALQFSDLGADGVAGPASVELDLDLTAGSIKVERR